MNIDDARIYGGVHFRFDQDAGARMDGKSARTCSSTCSVLCPGNRLNNRRRPSAISRSRSSTAQRSHVAQYAASS